MDGRYAIRPMDHAQVRASQAMALVWDVFVAFEAPDYTDEGVREFQAYIAPDAVAARMAQGELLVWGCFDGKRIVGVIAARPPCHISLLFVDEAYHRRGIARALCETVLDHSRRTGDCTAITVNASPYRWRHTTGWALRIPARRRPLSLIHI